MADQTFGLDIGRSFVKTVQVKSLGSKKILTAAASLPIPSGGIQQESPIELKKVSEAVKVCVENAKVEGEKCTVSLVESQAVTRLIEMPDLTDKELASAINYEADQYIPLPLKEVNLQYKIVSRPQRDSDNKMQVLLVAAPLRVIKKYSKIVKDAGLTLSAVETESTALARALTKAEDSPILIATLGAYSTELVIVQNGGPIFTRSIATGGLALTRAIVAEFGLPQNQAEEYKKAYGILKDKLSGKVSSVLRPILEVLINEILKAIEFTKSHMKDYQFANIVVCGGGAYLPGLSEFLTERTGLEVSLGDPWQDFAKEGLVLKLVGQGSFYCIATGLALRTWM